MPSFDSVNYSLRPSKSIQRQLVFRSIRLLQSRVGALANLVYVGLGSIWFTDFVLAHKELGVTDMISIEENPVGYCRAVFNAPYATVRVKNGSTAQVLPELFTDGRLSGVPWLVWLDYDYCLKEAIVDDVRTIIQQAPRNSILLITFNGLESNYGKPAERPERLQTLLPLVVSDNLSSSDCKGDSFHQKLADYTLDFMKATAADIARPGGFTPAFRLLYKDGTPMITVGGLLAEKEVATYCSQVIDDSQWSGRPSKMITAPHLTLREAVVLQALLPSAAKLDRAAVKQLGFDLEENQIEAFEMYYRHYPIYAQLVT